MFVRKAAKTATMEPGTRPARMVANHRQRGVTLIEILITLLILAVGLLGLAALQGISLQSGHTSYLRTQATNFAYEVADHARANRSLIESSGNVPNAGFWNTRAAQLMPAGSVTTTVTGADNDQLTVTVTWLDDREAGTNEQFLITTQI